MIFARPGKIIWPPFAVENLKPPRGFSKACKHHLACFCGLGSQAFKMIFQSLHKSFGLILWGLRPPKGPEKSFGLVLWFGVSGLQNDFSTACKNHLASFCGLSPQASQMIFQGLHTLFGLHMCFGVSGPQNDFSKACNNHLASFCGASDPPNDFSKALKNHLASFCGLGPQASKCFSKTGKNI